MSDAEELIISYQFVVSFHRGCITGGNITLCNNHVIADQQFTYRGRHS